THAQLLRRGSDEFGDVAEQRKLGSQVHHVGKVRSEPRPDINVSEGIGTARTDAALIIMRKKLGLIGCNVHPDRTLALTPFAGKTKIERMLNVMVMPSV